MKLPFLKRWFGLPARPASFKNNRPRRATFLRPVVQLLEDRVLPSTIFWNSSSSGLWNVPTNWLGDQVPGAGDDAVINQAGPLTVTIQANDILSVNSLTTSANDTLSITGGSLALAAPSVLSGSFAQSGGTLSAANTVTLSGGGQWTGGVISGPFTGSGSVTLSSGDLDIGASGATFNFPASVFTWSGGTLSAANGGTLSNTGAITLTSANVKDLNLGIVLNNTGTITDNGTNVWRFFNGAVLNNQSGGVVDMNSAEVLQVNSGGGTFNNLGGAKFESTGAGSSTTVPFNNQPGAIIDVDSSSFILAGGGVNTGGTFNVNGAGSTLDLTGGQTNDYTGVYTGSGTGAVDFTGGAIEALGGPLVLDFPQSYFQWSGGTLAGGAIDNTGFLTLTGAGLKDLNILNATPTVLNNSGTITDNGSNFWRFFNGSVLNNQAGGVVDMASAETIQNQSGGGTINNLAGATFENTGAGSSTSVPFNNQPGAIIEVDAGTFSLAGGGADSGGTFTVAPTATLDLTGGSAPILTGVYGGSGGGTVSLAAGALQFGAAGATFNFPAGMFVWSGGTLSGGTLSNTGAITLTSGNVKDLNNGIILDNTGTITDNGTNAWRFFNASILNNQSGGIVDMNSTEVVQINSGGGTINNLSGATFENTGAGSSTSVPFNNQPGAIIEVDAGTFTLAGGGADSGGTFTVAPTATLDLTGGSVPILSGTYTGSGGGTVSLASGALQIDTAGATFNFPAGLFVWSGGTISAMAGGVLSNTGAITLTSANVKDLNNGIVLDNAGTITDDGSNVWRFFNGAMLLNQSGGVVDMNSAETIQNNSGGGTFDNLAGATLENTGAGSSTNVPFNNQAGAVIEVDTGTFSLAGGGFDGGGIFTVAPGATLDLTGGSAPTLTGLYTGNGGGTVLLASGNLQIGGAGATFDFPAGLFVWSGGDISGVNGGALSNIGAITLTGSGVKDMDDSLVLNNTGTITDNGSNFWRFFNASVLNNQSGGIVDMNSAESLQNNSGGGTVNNFGGATFKSTGAGSSTSVPFNNQPGAIIEVDFSSFVLAGGGASTGGTFNVNGANSTLDLTGGTTNDFTGTYSGGGTGTVVFSNGVMEAVGSPLILDFPQNYFLWSGGTLAGGAIENTGFLNLTGSGTKDLNSLNSTPTVVNNTGTITDHGTNVWRFFNGSVLNNLAGGVVDINSTEIIQNNSGGGTINNLGGATFENTGSGSSTTVPFNNQPDAIIAVPTGTFSLAGGGADGGGTFTVAPGATLDLTGGSAPILTGTYTGSGGGTVTLAAGALQVAPTGATFDFPAGMFLWSGGTLSVLDGGVLTNTGAITLTSGNVKDLNGIVLDNTGTITDHGSNAWRFFNGSVLNNQFGGVVNLASAESIQNNSGGGTINNLAGATLESTGPGTFTTVPFDNAGGTIEVDAATFSLAGGGTDSGGSFTVGIGATLDLTGGSTPTVTGDYTGNGDGIVSLASGTLQIGAAGATFDFPAGLFAWSGGFLSGGLGGTLNNTGAITLTGANNKDMNELVLDNTGTITDAGSNFWVFFNGSVLNNQAGGSVNITTAESLQNNTGGGTINNLAGATFAGTTGASSQITVPFNNLGLVEAANGAFSFTNVSQVSGTDLTGGSWLVSGSGQLTLPGGSLTENDASVTISGAGAFPQLQALATNTGNLSVEFGADFTIQGNLKNSGTVTLGPGGTLSVNGNFTQNPAGTLVEDLGGAPGSGLFGQLNVVGPPHQAAVNGTFDLALVNGFAPIAGEVYTTAAYPALTGSFATINGGSFAGTQAFTIAIGSSSIVITATATAGADLAPSAITIPAGTAALVGQPVTVDYTVQNLQPMPTFANSWTDSVYLSADGVIDSAAVLLGTVTHSGAIAGNSAYAESLTANVPPMLPGNYQVVVQADSANDVPDINRLNNTLTSSGTIAVDMPHINAGTPTVATIQAGQKLYFRVDLPAGADVDLDIGMAKPNEVEVFESNGAIPNPTAYGRLAAPSGPNQLAVSILDANGGTYYVLVEGLSSAGTGQPVTFSLRNLGFEIVGVSPAASPNVYGTSLTISGSHFTANTAVALLSNSVLVTPFHVVEVNSNTLVATFDLNGVAPGIYGVQISDNGQQFTEPLAFQVTPATTIVTQQITTNTEWFAGQVYYLTSNVDVTGGATLTIDPGAIVKFDPGLGLTIDASSRLVANGTVAQPIVFTSIKDDANGGDTNNDGSATSPAAGDWSQILIQGQATFDHVEVLYGSGVLNAGANGGAIRNAGGSVTFSNSLLSQAFYDGLDAAGGVTTITNSVIVGADRGAVPIQGAVLSIVNSTFDDNRIGIYNHANGSGTLTVTNSVVSNSLAFGIANDGGPVTVTYSDVWSMAAGNVNYSGITDPTGTNGDISADPKYVAPTNGNYRLGYGSPAVDAANGAVSPFTDQAGDPRYNDPRTNPKTGVADANNHYPDMGAFEFEEDATSTIDLAAANVSGPQTVVAGETATVTWTDINLGSAAASGPWHDEIELVQNPGVNQTVIVAGSVLVAAGAALGPNQTISLSGTITVPGGLPGSYFWQIVPDAVGDVFQGKNQGVGVGVSAVSTALSLPALRVDGTALSSAFNAAGQTLWYEVTPASSEDLLISLSDQAALGNIDLFAAQGYLPTPSHFDFKSQQFDSPEPTLLIPSPQAGQPYYVIAYTLTGAALPFTLSAVTPQFSLSGAAPSIIGNSGAVTLKITGGQLAAADTYQLVGAGGTFSASQVNVQDSSTVYANFNLNGAAAGAYNVVVTPATGAPATLNAAVQVQATIAPTLSVHILVPSLYRPDRVFHGTIVYQNTGNVDMPAPIMILSTGGVAELSLDGQAFSSSDLMLIGASFSGPAGVLRPGQQFSIPFSILSTAFTTISFQLKYDLSTDKTPVNYTALEAQVGQAGYSNADFNALWTYFQQQAGPTWGGIVTVLSQYATYIAAVGQTGFDSEATVFAFALDGSLQRADASATGFLYLNDTNHPLAGATIVLANATTGNSAGNVTEPDGSFLIDSLPAGTYDVTIEGYLLPSPVEVTVPAVGSTTGLSIVVDNAGAISGSAFNQFDNSGIAGITVDATNTTDQTFYGATTDKTGTFTLSGLTAGTYDLVATGGSWGTQYASGVSVSPATTTSAVNFAFSAAATVEGLVQIAGAPAVGAHVLLTDADGRATGAFADATGAYSFTGLSPGTWTLQVIDSGYAPFQATLQLFAGVTTQEPTVSLAAGASLTVTLTDQSSNPLTQGLVELVQNGQALQLQVAATNGQAVISDLAAGIYTVTSEADGYLRASQVVMLTAGVPTSISQALQPASTIQGVVVDGGAIGIANFTVTAIGIDANNNEISAQATTAADGTYQLSDLPYASYTVTVGNGFGILRQDVVIDAATPQGTADFTVTGTRLQGTVLQANGVTPQSSATVFLDQNGQQVALATTDANGAYTFRVVQSGSYTVAASTTSALSPVQAVTISGGSNQTANPLILGGLTLTGVVDGPSGAAVSGATVNVLADADGSATQAFQVVTASNGSFSVAGLPAGQYTVAIGATGLASALATVSLPANNQTFTLQSAAALGGKITAAGQPVNQATVEIVNPANDDEVGYTVSSANGAYFLANVAAGTYDVIARAPGYQLQELTGVAVPGAVNIALSPASTTVTGTVTDDHGEPVYGAVVAVYNASGELLATASTGVDGVWSTNQLAAGVYTVQVTQVGYWTARQSGVQVSGITPTNVNLTLTNAGTDDDLITPQIDLLPFSEGLGSILSVFLQSQNPTATRSPDDQGLSFLPAPLCETLIPMYLSVSHLQQVTNTAFDNWEYANKSFNGTVGAGAGALVSQLVKITADVVQLVEGAAFEEALGALKDGANTTKDALLYAGKATTNSVVNNSANLQSLSSGLDSLSTDVETLYAGASGNRLQDLQTVAADFTNLASAGIGIAGNFANLNPALQPMVSLLGDVASLGIEFNNTYNAFLAASGPVLQAQAQYLQAVRNLKGPYFAYIQANHTCPPNPPPGPNPPNPTTGPTTTTTGGAAGDPNDLTTTGFGPQNFVSLSDAITYTIDFENEPTATAAAQQVVITDQLPTTLDWSTVQLTSIEFNGVTLTPGAGVSAYQGQTTVATDPSHPVDVNVTFDPSTGILTWTLTSIDPVTGTLSEDPLAGFLPPDNAQQQGEGYVTFTVKPASGLTTPTPISNQATVVFDLNSPINTPAVVNTIDAGAPTSSIVLPAYSATPSFPVSWAGHDDAGGAGIASFNVFVSDNNGPWQLWQNATTALSAVYAGQVGHTYGFYTVAIDNVGNQQPTPAGAQASINVPTYQASASEFENGAPTTVAIGPKLLAGHFGDADANTKQGIAVVQLGGSGIWQYSTNGTAWTTISNVSPTHALLLPAADSLHFTPAANWNGQADLFFLAWDGSQGAVGGTANASIAGGTTAFSSTAGVLALTVKPVPIWVGAGAHLTSIAPGVYNPPTASNPAGNSVSSIFASFFLDVNPAATVGVAVVSVPATANGIWQFSTNTGTTWTAFPTVSATAALLLSASDEIRFVPKNNFAGIVSLNALAWDGTVGTAGALGNPAKLGSVDFSAKTLTATLAVNKAPTLKSGVNVTEPALTENTTGPALTVSSLLTPAQAGYSATQGTPGIAVTSAVSAAGTLEYMLLGGSWQVLPNGSTSAALLLPSTASLRFVSASQIGTATLTFVGWNQTEGVAGQTFNVTSAGNATAFSVNSATLSIPVKQAPSWSATSGAGLTPLAPGIYGTSGPTAPAGNTIRSVFRSFFQDATPSVTVGVAIAGLTGANIGLWQYSTNAGSSWLNFTTAPTTSAALLLSANDEIRFVPNNNVVGTATLTAFAWDGGNGVDGQPINVTKTGGVTDFSAKPLTAIAAVNKATTLNAANLTEPPLAENTTSPAILVSSLLTSSQANFSASDGTPGIAIISAVSTTGSSQYMLAGGTWLPLPNVSASAALLLPSTASLRFAAGSQFGTATLTFAGWNQTQGAAGQLFDITSRGAPTAFSVNSATLTLTVQQAPSWSATAGASLPTLAPGVYTTTPPAGSTIQSVFGSFFVDGNPTPPTVGVAISGLTGTANGVWQYSLNTGLTWLNFPTTTSSNAALLLSANDEVRFVPKNNTAGTATLIAHAWDGSVGTHGNALNLIQTGVGAATAFSAATLTAVSVVNTAPTLTPLANGITLAPINETVTSPTVAVTSLLSQAHYGEPDGKSFPSGIAITGDAGPGTWQWFNGKSWTAVPSVPANSAFLLPSADVVRFMPLDNLPIGTSSLSATLTYLGWDQTTGAAGMIAALTSTGGTSAFSKASAPALATMLVNFVSQAPTWAAGVSASFTPVLGYLTPTTPPAVAGDTVASVFGSAFRDAAGALPGVAISAQTGSSEGVWQYQTSGTTTWKTFPTLAASAALLLSANDKIRFVPNKSFSGVVSLTAYAWDGTGGFTPVNGNLTANVTKTGTGGAHPFSPATLTANCFVNTAPTLT